ERNMLTFQSLGEEPVLEVTLAQRDRFDALGWALALGLALAGIAITGRPARQKAGLVIGAALAAAVLPLVWDNVAVAWQANMVFYAASLLVPYYLLAGAVRWLARRTCCRWTCCPPAAAAALLIAAGLVWSFAGLA